MRRSIDDSRDDHPSDAGASPESGGDESKPPVSWMVQMSDDCEECGHDARVVLTLEEVGRPAEGVVAHLAPATARRLRAAIAAALGELGEEP